MFKDYSVSKKFFVDLFFQVPFVLLLDNFCIFDVTFITPQPFRAVGVLFSPMVPRRAGGRVAGKSLSGLYLRNGKA